MDRGYLYLRVCVCSKLENEKLLNEEVGSESLKNKYIQF